MRSAIQYTDSLKDAGYRVTSQRRIICDYLAETDQHPTPYQVYAGISQVHPEISRATVYNTLNVLAQLGVIVEIAIGSDHTHYETNAEPHINLICLRCHQVVDHHQPGLPDDLQADIRSDTGFEPVTARIDMLGFCEECRERKRAEIIAQWNAQHED